MECDMATSEQASWADWCTSHLRIVLLGGRNSGKSLVGNLILGQEEFVTQERTSCCRRLATVAGRLVTVVDTPGWWCDFRAWDTAHIIKQEIITSVSLCSPGPHVFLIVVKASSFLAGKRQKTLEEHLALLGESVWSHCMVLFTSTDCPAFRTTDMHVKARQWLSDKCRHKCHTLVLRSNVVDTQVKDVLVKIQKFVTENGNRHFEMQESILQITAEKKRQVEERALQRFLKMKKQRSLLQQTSHYLSDIRIVLVGAKGSGKTSTMNTILGREGNVGYGRTARCMIEEGSVSGRHVSVVDTPGWWMNYFTEDSSIFDRREIARSLSLCPPGPHALLLVVRVDRAFTTTYRRAVQEHLELIAENIWTHVIVIFSFGDWLGDTTIEQYIESEGGPLQWLVEKCSNRYHVFNNKTKGDGFQIRELMGKIEEMVAGNNSCCCEMELELLQKLEEEMRLEKERAKGRLIMQKKQRQVARSQLEKLNPLPELKIVLVGGKNTGKSSSGNTIMGKEVFDTDGKTAVCVERRGQVGAKTVTVLDTPGWMSVNPDLLTTPSSCGLTALLVVVNVSSSFTQAVWEAMDKQLELLGEKAWDKVMVLFSYGDWLGETNIEEHIESEGNLLQRLVERCGNRYHVLNNKSWGDRAQVDELLDQIEEMLVEGRVSNLEKGHQMGQTIKMGHVVQLDGVTQYTEDLKKCTSHRDQLSCEEQPPTQHRALTDGKENANDVYPLCHARQRERALIEFTTLGCLQEMIDQWGSSNLEELEAFIDSYFEVVWEQAMASLMAKHDCSTSDIPDQDSVVDDAAQDVLSSIDKKLSKLDLLEEIQRDMQEMKLSLFAAGGPFRNEDKCEGKAPAIQKGQDWKMDEALEQELHRFGKPVSSFRTVGLVCGDAVATTGKVEVFAVSIAEAELDADSGADIEVAEVWFSDESPFYRFNIYLVAEPKVFKSCVQEGADRKTIKG
ncbi:GTPase IMAP family member 8-like [Lampris incognitus]|uniref:GTPase IMAP family member 8-like n=1 Tax=Lampris incognitus TaxID=2546036 RepID=UPI0024B59CE6|nr:GTPase IMAP family member 8-like [Lampris incognitus]